jgi:hypothetical protein
LGDLMKTGKVTAKTISILLTLCLLGLGIIPPLAACQATCCMGLKMLGPGNRADLIIDRPPQCCCCGQETASCDMQKDNAYEVSDRIPLTSQRPEIPSLEAAATLSTFTDPPFNSATVFGGTEKTSGVGPPIPIFLLNLSFLC